MSAIGNRRAWSRAFVLTAIYFAVVALLLAIGMDFGLTLLLLTAAGVLLASLAWRGIRHLARSSRR
ncbi:hypothetical protein MMX123_02753 [Microbacterium sp. MM2322]